MKKFLLSVAACLFLTGCSVQARGVIVPIGKDGPTLAARLSRLVPAAFLNTPIPVSVETENPFVMWVRFGTSNVLAYYDPRDKSIHIRADLTGYDRDRVLVHEYGHFVSDVELGMRERQAWVRLWKHEKHTVITSDEYRGANYEEGFAEAFSFYCVGDEVNRHAAEDSFIRKVQTRIENWSRTL